MRARTPSGSATAAGSGLLLLACGAATAAATAALAPTLPGARIVAGGLVAAAAVVAVLGAPGVRRRPVVQALLAGLGLGVAGQVFSSVGSDAPAVVPAAGAAVLLWSALAPGRGGALRLALPVAAAAGLTWVNGAPGVPAAVLAAVPAAVVVGEALAWPLSRARWSRRTAVAALADVDSLLVAALDLRGVDDIAAACDRICRLGSELLDGDGALLYVQGPGRLLLGGRHGRHPGVVDTEAGRDPGLDEVMRAGAVRPGDPVLVPVAGAAGVIGVLAVGGSRRPLDGLTTGVVQLFGSQAGAVLDRLNAIESLYDDATRDPVTGVGNRQQAAAVIASLRPGDGLLLLEVDAFESFRRANGDAAADLLLGQFGLHLRKGTRAGDAVARYGDHQFVVALPALKAPVEFVVRRLVDSWMAAGPSRTISVGGALHLDGAPLDTVDRASSALTSARRRGGGAGHVAADFAVLTP